MILPRDWRSHDGKHYMQYVSHHKSERDDVVQLKESLDKRLSIDKLKLRGYFLLDKSFLVKLLMKY